MSTQYERQQAKRALVKKFWGNAHMGHDAQSRNFQAARLSAWTHGMREGFKAALKLERRK